jgi:cobalamin synthase
MFPEEQLELQKIAFYEILRGAPHLDGFFDMI